MLRFKGIIQQIVSTFIVQPKSEVVCDIGIDRYSAVFEAQEPVMRSTGCVQMEYQPEEVKTFLLSLIDSHGKRMADGRRVAFVAIVSETPRLPTGVSATNLVGLDFKKIDDVNGSTYRVMKVEGTGVKARLYLSVVEPGEVGSVVELYGSFIQNYVPDV